MLNLNEEFVGINGEKYQHKSQQLVYGLIFHYPLVIQYLNTGLMLLHLLQKQYINLLMADYIIERIQHHKVSI